jgi:MoaA/NifB/PqqE/SkfB family radical SAM enzyme
VSKPLTRSVDLIWNMTLVCPYNCAICCVDAVHVRRRGRRIELRSQAESTDIVRNPSAGSIYEQAGRFRQLRGLELTLDCKLRILDHLAGFAPRLDFSGGDLLVLAENVDVLSAAAARFGRDTITITATGAGVSNGVVEVLPSLIGHFNFTFDSTRSTSRNRPSGYAASNLKTARRLADGGVAVRAELPLTRSNSDVGELTRIYEALHAENIERVHLMRLFPVGRSIARAHQIPSRYEYLTAIEWLRRLELRYGRPRVTLQCALRHLEPNTESANPCNAVTTSFGIMPDGTLLRSAWAIEARGRPLHPSWVLGNVAEVPLDRILDAPHVAQMRERANENHGHCKVFAFINGRSRDPNERYYERSDPLYSTDPRHDPGIDAWEAPVGSAQPEQDLQPIVPVSS